MNEEIFFENDSLIIEYAGDFSGKMEISPVESDADSFMSSLEDSSGESEEILSEEVLDQEHSLDESSVDSMDELGLDDSEEVIESFSIEPFDYEMLDAHFQQIHEDLFLIAAILLITFAKGCLRSWREKNVKEVR